MHLAEPAYKILPSGPTLVLALICLGLAYLALLIFYRLTYHPLARFPGPKIAAATKAYEAYFDLIKYPGGQYTREIKRLHGIYGPIVRINPNEISINDPDFHERLYAPQPAVRDKFPPIARILGTRSGTFGTVDHYVHRKRRAANSGFFSLHNIARSEPLIVKHVERLCERLQANPKNVWELRVTFLALKLDIFFEYAFADTLGLQDDPKLADDWDQTINAIATCAPYIKMFPSLLPFATESPVALVQAISPPLARVLRLKNRIRQQAAIFAQDLASYSFSENDPSQRPQTIFQVLYASDLPASEKTVDRVSQEGAEMFAAAGTTARIMTTAMFHLHEKPAVLRRLQQELDEAIPDPTVIPPVKVLETLPYMGAVIKESLRKAAPVATRLPLIPREPMKYGDWVIPGGTPLSVNSRDMLHDPSIFADPEDFVPERWMPSNPADTIPERYFVPFGKGARKCQGQDFAMLELQVTISTLIRRFEFELVDTVWERDVEVVRDCFLSEPRPGTKGPKLRIKGFRL